MGFAMDKLNNWAATLTNIGVILGLVLVAYQINQTNEVINQESVEMQIASYTAGDEIMGEFQLRLAICQPLPPLSCR